MMVGVRKKNNSNLKANKSSYLHKLYNTTIFYKAILQMKIIQRLRLNKVTAASRQSLSIKQFQLNLAITYHLHIALTTVKA